MTGLEQAEVEQARLFDQFQELLDYFKARGGGLSDVEKVKLADHWAWLCNIDDRLRALRDAETCRELEALNK